MNEARQTLERLWRQMKCDEQARIQRYQQASRQKLLRVVGRKFRTCFVGDLARFEKHFGSLWGHGKQVEDCTAEQLVWREVWQMCRQEIFDNGHQQLSATQAEVSEYNVSWNRYHMDLVTMSQEKENDNGKENGKEDLEQTSVQGGDH
jgi:hypothetical protein